MNGKNVFFSHNGFFWSIRFDRRFATQSREWVQRNIFTTYYEHWLAALEMRIEETKLHSKAKSDTTTPEDVDAIVPTGNYFRGID